MAYRVKNKGSSMATSLLAGFGISWLLTIIAAMIITALLVNNSIPQEAMATAAVIATLAISWIAAFLARRMQGEKKLPTSLLVGAIYYVSLLGCNALFYEGEYTGLLGALLTIMGSSLVAGLLQTRQKRQRPSYRKRFGKT